MQPIVIDRLSKLGPQDWLSVHCGDCRCPKHTRGVELDIPAAIARYGDLPLFNLGRFFRCSLCGYKPAEIRHGYRMLPAVGVGWITPAERNPTPR